MPESARPTASFDEWDRAEGTPGPMGVTWIPTLSAWNFALYSRQASSVTLLLYSADDPIKPIFEQRLNPRINKCGQNLALLGCGGSRAVSRALRVSHGWTPRSPGGLSFRSSENSARPIRSRRFISRRLSTASPTACPDLPMVSQLSVYYRDPHGTWQTD